MITQKLYSKLFSSLLLLLSLAPLHADEPSMYFCTAADSRYYRTVLNLIGSIYRVNFNETAAIAVFDLGLSPAEVAHLNRIKKVTVYQVEKTHPSIIAPIESHPGKKTPGSYAWKPVVIKQALDMYPHVLYVDAGTTILKPLNDLFRHIIEHGYFVMDVGPWSIHWQSTRRVIKHFNLETPENSWILAPATHAIDAGFQGVSRAFYDSYIMPLYNLTKTNFDLFVDDGTTPNGRGTCRHDQTLFSIYTRLLNFTILLHDTDGNNQMTLLKVDDKTIPIHITWNTPWVNNNTTVFRSRGHIPNFNYYTSFLQYK